MASFIELYEQGLAQLGQTVVKVYTENCHWCRRLIARPTTHNFVHLGGRGDVPICDKCLSPTHLGEAGKSD